MQEIVEARATPDGEVSLRDVLRWAARWWGLILCGCVAGGLFGLIWHLASDERFTVRFDMTITESPVGSASFVREVSTNFLRRHVGTSVVVEFDPRKGRLSLVEGDVPADAVAVRRVLMQGAAAALEDFLDGMASREYARMQERFMTMEPSPEAYASLSRLRLHVSALQDGLLRSVVVVTESARRRDPALAVLLGLGALLGAGLATAAAFAAEAAGRGRGGRVR